VVVAFLGSLGGFEGSSLPRFFPAGFLGSSLAFLPWRQVFCAMLWWIHVSVFLSCCSFSFVFGISRGWCRLALLSSWGWSLWAFERLLAALLVYSYSFSLYIYCLPFKKKNCVSTATTIQILIYQWCGAVATINSIFESMRLGSN